MLEAEVERVTAEEGMESDRLSELYDLLDDMDAATAEVCWGEALLSWLTGVAAGSCCKHPPRSWLQPSNAGQGCEEFLWWMAYAHLPGSRPFREAIHSHP